MRLAVLFDNLGPYHRARLAAAATEVDVFAIECFGRSDDYAWQASPARDFPCTTLFPEHGRSGIASRVVRRRLGETLDDCAPDVVAIPGWSSQAAFCALRWCLAQGVSAIAMSDSTAWDMRRSWLREATKRRLVRCFSAALVGGAPHRAYALDLGFPAERIFTGYDAVDNAFFADAAEQCRRGKAPACLPERPYFLASCRFIPEKNLMRLLAAFGRYREKAGEAAWDLVLLGDGSLKAEIVAERKRLRLESALHLPGFVQYEDLPAYFARAGALVHPSMTEPWGLVVNEAMASGLPVIVSKRCGCAADLVADGVNGFTFDPANIEELATLLVRVASADHERAAMGEASRARIGEWGVENFAVNLRRAGAAAMANPPAPAGIGDLALLTALALR